MWFLRRRFPARSENQNWRLIRATLRDWRVLFREFRWPLVWLLLIGEVVALLFRLFYTHPNYPNGLSVEEAYYAVVTLMVIEGAFPFPVGNGHWLTIFYFLMPLVGIFLAGQGLANFLSLLFNRRARGQAWHDAIASTYSNHIVVCGLGHVGSRVVESLMEARVEVVGITNDLTSDVSVRMQSQRVAIVEGDIRRLEVLRRAGVARARAAVICSDNDMANLEAAFHCRELAPNIRLVLRLFDADLAQRVKTTLGIDEAFSASALAAPIFAGAALDVQIDRTYSIGDDLLNVGRFTINAGSQVAGARIKQVEEEIGCTIIIHQRGEQKDTHPAGNVVLAPGDRIVVLAAFPTLNSLARWNQPR